MGLFNNAVTRVIGLMVLVTFLGLGAAWLYYQNINKSEDPRVVKAKLLYKKYNQYVADNNYSQVLEVLDSIDNIYASVEHYASSFERGVVYTNQAAFYLTIGIYRDSINPQLLDKIPFSTYSKDSLLKIAKVYTDKSIQAYQQWQKEYENLNEKQMYKKIEPEFRFDDPEIDKELASKYISKRVEDITFALKELERRLSVSYTNLGIIMRHQEKYDAAIKYYKKAIELWDRNYSAKNNLNILLGRPQEKPSIIEKIFPPEKSD